MLEAEVEGLSRFAVRVDRGVGETIAVAVDELGREPVRLVGLDDQFERLVPLLENTANRAIEEPWLGVGPGDDRDPRGMVGHLDAPVPAWKPKRPRRVVLEPREPRREEHRGRRL